MTTATGPSTKAAEESYHRGIMIRGPLAFSVVGVTLWACTVDSVDLRGKECPCADGWVCDTVTNRCVAQIADSGSTGGAAGSAGTSSGGSGASGGSGGSGATGGSGGSCSGNSKLCAGHCVPESPSNGCASTSCQACVSGPYSTSICANGSCGLSCESGHANCNSTLADGCEQSLSSDANCGKCGRTCSLNHASSTDCYATACQPKCLAGYANCNEAALMVPDDGCETSVSASNSNCGACGYSCSVYAGLNASFSCASGRCGCTNAASCALQQGLNGVACAGGGLCMCGNVDCHAGEQCRKATGGNSSECSCHGGPACAAGESCCASGCSNLQTDPANCGACGVKCNGPCSQGACT